ncbi:hypothetical protein [Vagococcus fluvialis]|uniref:hypothetical protein n=1 Tax=Vagococcus fluvialis TaxID=2738 RepID=UPI003B5A9262
MKNKLLNLKDICLQFFETDKIKKISAIIILIILFFLLLPKKENHIIKEEIGGPKINLTPEKKSTP